MKLPRGLTERQVIEINNVDYCLRVPLRKMATFFRVGVPKIKAALACKNQLVDTPVGYRFKGKSLLQAHLRMSDILAL